MGLGSFEGCQSKKSWNQKILLAKIGGDTAENQQHFAEILPVGRRVADHVCPTPTLGQRRAGRHVEAFSSWRVRVASQHDRISWWTDMNDHSILLFCRYIDVHYMQSGTFKMEGKWFIFTELFY